MAQIRVKDWFLAKTLNQQEMMAVKNGADFEIVRETEKAYYIAAVTDFGAIRFWCPKSCTLTAEEIKAEREATAQKMQSGLAYNEALVEFCKANGIKVGARNRTATLIEKIQNAGLEVPAR